MLYSKNNILPFLNKEQKELRSSLKNKETKRLGEILERLDYLIKGE